MLYRDRVNKAALLGNDDPDHPPDAGIFLSSRANDFGVIVNALFAHPPFTPAVDVYDRGQLIAGYTYYQIKECIQALSELLPVHLPPAGEVRRARAASECLWFFVIGRLTAGRHCR
jgi:hypothetical protein